jgi:phenylalanyl-tRNA synthetase beta chain
MKISYNWLKEYIITDKSVEEVASLLTQSGLEVESVTKYEQVKGGLEGVVIGEVKTCVQHPNADRLRVTTVDVGNDIVLPIVCGAPNVAAGQRVVVATPGAVLYPLAGDSFKIQKTKIRGEVSEGMICAEDEIGLGVSHDGIMVLETDLPPGTPASRYFKIETDSIIEIGLTPNRADAASHMGVARDLKAILKTEVQVKSIEEFKHGQIKSPINVELENTEACPRYSGLYFSNVTVNESPEWLKQRLKAIGLTPINNIVDITNFILHDIGQPMHAFDADKIKGQTVRVKTLPEGTPFLSLDGMTRKLKSSDLMICDGEDTPMCIGGVFGGIASGVTKETRNVFLESAYFSPDFIRKSSQAHALKTDAAFRYERGTDPNITVYALKRAAILINQLAGGIVSSDLIDIYPNPVSNFEFTVEYKNIDRLIGKKLDRSLINEILTNLDIKVTQTEESISVSVPPYRVDVKGEADIAEEVLRIYGLNNLELSDTFGTSYLAEFPSKDSNKIQYKTSQLLASLGFNEIITNSLTKPLYNSALSSENSSKNVEILNKLSEDLGVLRQSLLFTSMEVAAYNINRRQRNLKLFEFGKVYFKENDQYIEKNKLALLLTGNQSDESWKEKSRAVSFFDIKGVVTAVLQKNGLKETIFSDIDQSVFSYGLSALYNNKTVATFGLVKKELCKISDIKQDVYFAEFDWDMIIKYSGSKVVFKDLPKFPEVRRDLSLVLDKSVKFRDIEKLAYKLERQLLKEVNVFDVYEGPNIGEDKKAYSISFILQHEEQTLTDKVIDKTMEKLMGAFESELKAVIRK